MRTVICPSYLKAALYHELAKENGFVTDVSVQSLPTFFNLSKPENAVLLLQSKHVLQAHAERFPIYGAMFSYPTFMQELLSFAKTCALFNITGRQLPTRTAMENELRAILELLRPFTTYEQTLFQKQEKIKAAIRAVPDLSIYTGFEKNSFLYRMQEDLIKAGVPASSPRRRKPKERLLRTALNLRQEAEAVVQDICRESRRSIIVLCSYAEQFPVLQPILERYKVPYSCIDDCRQVKAGAVFNSLVTFALQKDTASFLQVLAQEGFSLPCPDAVYPWLCTVMQTLKIPEAELSEAIFPKEAGQYNALQKSARAYLQAIQPEQKQLSSAATPQAILLVAYTLLTRHPLLKQEREQAAARTIHSFLQAVLPDIGTEEDVRFIVDVLLSVSFGKDRRQGNFVTVTDLTHPIDAQEKTYVLNADGRNYPGFPGMHGLFDEDYVAEIDAFPSLQERHDMYRKQLEWVEQSASDQLYYSSPSEDYQGREIQLAYAIESTFPKGAVQKWPLIQMTSVSLPSHSLTSETAKTLFAPNGFITGSVSTIERWFACPYSWFLQAGLQARQKTIPGMDTAAFGTIQHALMEQAVKTFGKHYGEEADTQLHAWLQPYMDALIAFAPNDAVFIQHTMRHLEHNLRHTFRMLADFERHTSFTPAEAEKNFQEEIVDGVQLRGIIDRVDLCHDLLRIIDYKSSGHSLSQAKIKAGLQLQLLTYLQIAERLYAKKAAAAFYCSLKEERYPMPAASMSRGKILETKEEEAWLSDSFLEHRRLSGWNFDAEHKIEQDDSGTHIKGMRDQYDMDAVRAYMQTLYTYFRDQVLTGNISLQPTEGACTFCDYRAICRFQGDYRPENPIQKDAADFKVSKGKEEN